MSNPPPPSIPGGTPPPPSIPTPPAAPSVPKAPAAPAVPPVAAAPAAPAAPPAAAAPTIPLRPAGLGGGIKLGGGLKTVALGSATTPVAPVVPPAGAAPAAAAPTVPLTPPGAGMATAQLPQATIGLNTAPAASPVSSASFTARKFQRRYGCGSQYAVECSLLCGSCLCAYFRRLSIRYGHLGSPQHGWLAGRRLQACRRCSRRR